MKNYVFILCPPYQGSTCLLSLLSSSKNCSSFSTKVDLGEGQDLLTDEKYIDNRWDPEYDLDMVQFSTIYHREWDLTKNVLLDKSPPHICRALKIQKEFEKYGKVFFVISTRNPYSTKYCAEKWIEYAKYQQKNIEQLDNIITTSYEEMCESPIF